MNSNLPQIAKGSAQPFVSYDILNDINIPEHTESEEIFIGNLLLSIDHKIALNKSICTDLEAMVKQIYDYWFLQFDFPDENGKPYKSSGGKMVWCEELNREIPEGWEVKEVSDIGTLETNSIFPNEGNMYNHYSIPAFDEAKMPVFEDGKEIASNKYIVPNNCVLISKLNPQFKRIWLVRNSSDKAICSTEFLPVMTSEERIAFLYALLYSDAFSIHLQQKASSSTGSRKRISPENCMSFQFAFNDDMAMKFNKVVTGLIDKIITIHIENQQLTELRDFLLPILMNGQVTFSDQEGA